MLKLFFLLALIGLCSATIDIEKLLSKMSYEEKCGQMTQMTIEGIQLQAEVNDPDRNTINDDKNPLDKTKVIDFIKLYKIGSVLNTPYGKAQSAKVWQQIQKTIQEEAQNHLENKIPIIFGIDSIHGANYIREGTLMPQPLAMASSFNIDIAREVGVITAMETKAVGIPWNFNPVFDQGRDPIWPRLWETYGEDQYLATLMGLAYINGSQGIDPKSNTTVLTCLKHYIGYSTSRNGRDRSPAWIPEIVLREYFLPPFAAAVKAGSMTVMINSGEVNGIPGHANKQYMTDILKGELGFEGFVVSDWEDVKRLGFRDKVAENISETVRISVMAGLDMSMVPGTGNVQSLAADNQDISDFHKSCVSLAKNNEAFANRVDDANRRILKVKDLAGLFDKDSNSINPNPDLLKNVNADSSHEFNLKAAIESIILAKNTDNFLPINDKTKKLLVTGPTSDLLKVLNGGWTYNWQGDNEGWYYKFNPRDKRTVKQKLEQMYDEVTYVQGVRFNGMDSTEIDPDNNIDKAVAAANDTDLIVLCIGENTYTEGLGSITDLNLDDGQLDLAQRMLATNKPVIVVYLGGRPRIITKIVENKNVKSVLVSFLPGNRGGEAIGEIIYGNSYPSAKFPVTYPKTVNAWTNYDVNPIEQGYRNELYPFGFGLSYTTFRYSDLTLSKTSVEMNDILEVSVKVTNNGTREGKEVVILYLNDNFASISRPTKQVKRFEKILLKAGESKIVKFKLAYFDYTFINPKMQRTAEVGTFTVFVENLNAAFRLNSVENVLSSATSTIILSLNLAFITLITSIFNL